MVLFFHLYHFVVKVALFFLFASVPTDSKAGGEEQRDQSAGRPPRAARVEERPPGSGLPARSAAGLTVDVVHVHLEVVISRELLVAKLTFCERTIGVMCHLVSDQHLLQAKGQVAHLEKTQGFQSDPTEAHLPFLRQTPWSCPRGRPNRPKDRSCSGHEWNLASRRKGAEN